MKQFTKQEIENTIIGIEQEICMLRNKLNYAFFSFIKRRYITEIESLEKQLTKFRTLYHIIDILNHK